MNQKNILDNYFAHEYKCERCLATFSSKQRYNTHINKIKKCNILSGMEFNNVEGTLLAIKNGGDFTCVHCNKSFDKKYNLDRHLVSPQSYCYKQRSGSTIINNINNFNTNINAIQQILLVEHGKESVKHITKEILLKMLEQPNFIKFCVDAMTTTYFNRKVPKNNNWFIAYPKNDKAGVEFNHDTRQFERKSTVDIIDDKFSNMMELFQPLIEEIYKEDEETENLSHIQRMNVKKYYGYFGVMQISKECPEIYQAIHDLAYNMRIIPMTTYKEQGLDAKYLSIKF